MAAFNFTELESGEKLVFGPVTTSKTTSVSGGGGPGQGQGTLSHTSGRTVGVTSQRVIVEDLKSPEKTVLIPNEDVQQIFIKRQFRKGQPSLSLVKAQTVSGQAVKLDIKGLPDQAETMLKSTFPNAEVVESKGGGSKVLLIVAIIIGIVILLACVLPFILAGLGAAFGS